MGYKRKAPWYGARYGGDNTELEIVTEYRKTHDMGFGRVEGNYYLVLSIAGAQLLIDELNVQLEWSKSDYFKWGQRKAGRKS